MKLCISIAPKTMYEAITKLRSAGTESDLVELRIDSIRDLDLKRLLQRPRPTVIITNRTTREGGKFNETSEEQLNLLSHAMDLGAEYVDIEMSWGKHVVGQLRSRRSKSKIIVSYHNFKETPHNLGSIYNTMRSTKADIIKIATMANDITDTSALINLIKKNKSDKQKIIAICMGERGQISRTLGGKFGGFLTFASLRSDEQTASGQYTIDDLKNIYRIHTLNARTKIFGLVGNPVAQSKGIYFHNDLFQRKKLNAVYVNFLVDKLEAFIVAFKCHVSGLSITMPFKQEIAPVLDTIEEHAKQLGVVNTVLLRRKKLVGYNTDLPAIVSLLKKRTTLKRKRAIVLGTGGTAKTMAYAALNNGADTTIVGRSEKKAKTLAAELQCHWANHDDLEKIETDILMNGTSVGMQPEEDDGLVPKKFFRKEMIIFDAVYASSETTLLRNARAAGCRIITGEELFKCQAQLQSQLFLNTLV